MPRKRNCRLAINVFALAMGLLLAATGLYGARLADRLGLALSRRRDAGQTGRAWPIGRLIQGAVVLMGVGLALSGIRLPGAIASVALVVAAGMMLAGLLGIVAGLLVAMWAMRR